MRNEKRSTTIYLLVFFILLVGLAGCSAATSLTFEQPTSQIDPVNTADTLPINYSIETSTAPSLDTAITQTFSDLETSLIHVYTVANPSVVYIITATGSGSGFVYSEDGYIVTNAHVVSGSRSFEIVFASGERVAGSLVGSDTDGDLAVLKVEQLPDGITPLALAESELQVGQFVVAIGNPFGEQGSMSFGIVSGLGRSLPSQRSTISGSTYTLPEAIQTDAPINPGNSGGPLLNLQGEVVGVNAAIASETGENSGVGFSIPVKAVRLIVPELIKNGSFKYPYMGVSFDGEISISDQALYNLSQTNGIYVLSITQGSPAAQAGLQAANPNTAQDGDLITAIDDQLVKDFDDLNSYLVFETKIGQTIKLTVLRDGKQISLSLTLGARP